MADKDVIKIMVGQPCPRCNGNGEISETILTSIMGVPLYTQKKKCPECGGSGFKPEKRNEIKNGLDGRGVHITPNPNSLPRTK